MKTKIKRLVAEYKLLFKSVPSLIITFFVLATVLMNLLANRILFQVGDAVSADCGFLLSWIPFLCMDTVTKRFGAKASIMLNLFGVATNICCTILFVLVTYAPGNGEDFSAFDSVFRGVWFITLSSMIAYIVSGIINSLSNEAVGELFKKNPDGKTAFFVRAYVSTFIGQWIDNFLFAFLTYHIFANIYWGWSLTIKTCIGTAFAGAILELIAEAIFSPLGYKLSQEWTDSGVGAEWIESHSKAE